MVADPCRKAEPWGCWWPVSASLKWAEGMGVPVLVQGAGCKPWVSSDVLCADLKGCASRFSLVSVT